MSDLRVLVVTDQGDRPETGMVIKLHEAGVGIRVLCWEDCPYVRWLTDAGVPFEPLRLAGKRDRAGAREIARHLDEYRPHVLHLLRKQPIFNGLAAAKGRSVKVVLYRGIVGNVSFLNPLDWMSFLNPRVDRIVCVAEAVRQEFLRLGFAGLLAGVVVTEVVFAIPGIGRLTVTAMLQRDYPVIQAAIILVSGIYLLVNLMVDLSYAFFDPRIRY